MLYQKTMGAVTTAKWNHRNEELILRFARGDEPGPQDLRKTTLGVDVQTVGLNAEKKRAHRAEGEVFSLDIPFNRTFPICAVRQVDYFRDIF